MQKKVRFSLYILDTKCPYCGGEPKLKKYKKGNKWRCSKCGANVACHKNTDMPMFQVFVSQLDLRLILTT